MDNAHVSQFKFAKGKGKPIACIRYDELGNDKGQAFVEMQLEGNIYKMANVGVDEIVKWLASAK